MKVSLAILILLNLCPLEATQNAEVNLICLSPRILPGSARDSLTGLTWNLDVSTFDDPNNPNGELALAGSDVPYTHQSNFFLQDPTTFEWSEFPFVLDVPELGDVNENGVGDFFDVEIAVDNAKTEGRHPTGTGGGADFTATWNRNAGTSAGTVQLDFPFFGLKFTHEFDLVNYSGGYVFEVQSTNVSGSVTLTNALASDEVLNGPFALVFTNQNSLRYSPGSWNGTGDTRFDYQPVDTLDLIGTNYVSILSFEDGFPATSEPDYVYWLFVVKSPDENGNSIPDIVESGSSEPAPALEIVRTEAGVEITIKGIAGDSYILESTADLKTTPWTAVETVKLDSDSSKISRSLNGSREFFRLREG